MRHDDNITKWHIPLHKCATISLSERLLCKIPWRKDSPYEQNDTKFIKCSWGLGSSSHYLPGFLHPHAEAPGHACLDGVTGQLALTPPFEYTSIDTIEVPICSGGRMFFFWKVRKWGGKNTGKSSQVESLKAIWSLWIHVQACHTTCLKDNFERIGWIRWSTPRSQVQQVQNLLHCFSWTPTLCTAMFFPFFEDIQCVENIAPDFGHEIV